MKDVVFYNHFHLGDLHLSRTFVKKITDFVKLNGGQCFYSHKNNKDILKDTGTIYDDITHQNMSTDSFISEDDERIYLNTWYGANNFDLLNRYGISFDCLYHLFDAFCKNKLDCSLSDIDKNHINFYPEIDFSFYDVGNIDEWCKDNSAQKVFISNGSVLSGQSINFNFSPIIVSLAKRYTSTIFIVTSSDEVFNNIPNIICSRDIIKKNGCDLNENSYLSSCSNLIVGRSSGTFTFAMTKENFFDIGQTFLSFSNLSHPGQYWLNEFDSFIKYKSKVINKSIYDSTQIDRLILENLP